MAVTEEPRFDIVEGSLARADRGADVGIGGRLRRVPGLRLLVDSRRTQHVGSAMAMGRLVRETPRFVANELRGAQGVRAYTLRDGGRTVLLRHGTIDPWTFIELFVLRLYEPPEPVAAALAAVSEPVVLDLGANVGYFGALRARAVARVDGRRVRAGSDQRRRPRASRSSSTASGSARTLRRRGLCGGARRRALASMPFGPRALASAAEGRLDVVPVPAEDVLPVIAGVDLLKIDTEGGEWPILWPTRASATSPPRAVVLEYHPRGVPRGDDTARRRAADCCEGHGLRGHRRSSSTPSGVGMAVGHRSAARAAGRARSGLRGCRRRRSRELGRHRAERAVASDSGTGAATTHGVDQRRPGGSRARSSTAAPGGQARGAGAARAAGRGLGPARRSAAKTSGAVDEVAQPRRRPRPPSAPSGGISDQLRSTSDRGQRRFAVRDRERRACGSMPTRVVVHAAGRRRS